ncbi:axin-2 [Microcaecilia unicolor]|uniref:Axin-2 n=1 Tax=Microcaecilia unicolor TaxID=1415580 RepID=A0A6P7YHA0_9AMPH|nr:axin-2 [Microcaecilia unicolor]XP_030064322.1 axin-2 [Microcaecilia unicolor]
MSRAVLVPPLPDPSGSFREDAPRPPVPGEEGEAPPCQPPGPPLPPKPQSSKAMALSATPRRNEDGLGEPEGSATPDSPLARWTKSLHSLLGDQDGAYLFRTFLEREKCVDTLDFWFACNGFRQMDLKDTKTLRVAKAIYKRYVENHSIVSKQLKPATKTYIRDGIKKQQIDSVMFDQAQTEIQRVMEGNAYQMFLTSEVYLEYLRSGGENPAYVNNGNGGLGSLKLVCGYLPTLNEEEELSSADLQNKALASGLGLSGKARRATEAVETGYRCYKRNDAVNPYHVNSGYGFVPATSANDSEISSDALTDDSQSMTDSSVDGVPPYRLGSKKQLQREMHRSVKANGQVSLPHFPRTHCLPKEMTPVEPAAFAAELISRLEKLKQEQETMNNLEERLQQIKEDEEKEELELSVGPPSNQEAAALQHPLTLLPSGTFEDDPQAILDEHLSRVLKTPGCQSPGIGRHSPRARSPDQFRMGKTLPLLAPPSSCMQLSNGLITKQTTKHVHHHYIHHHSTPKTKEQIEAEAAQRVQCYCTSGTDCCYFVKNRFSCKASDLPVSPMDSLFGSRSGTLSRRTGRSVSESPALSGSEGSTSQLPGDETDRSQNVWQWIMESERQNKHKPHSVQSGKKACTSECTRGPATERTGRHHHCGGNGLPRSIQPAHPFVQDPAMPPLTPPNTLAQLEEACRRLSEVSKPQKQRSSTSNQQRERNHFTSAQIANTPFTTISPITEEHKDPKKPAAAHTPHSGELVVTYFFCGEEIPYRRMLKSQSLTLGHFKEQLSKKGNYRYYFKKASDEFDCGAVFEEIWADDAILPMYEGRILGKVERID